MARPISATLHGAALRHNLAVARRHASSSRIMAVIKANGYGHGLLHAARGLATADAFAILEMDEAQRLRAAGVTQPVVLLEGLFDPTEVKDAMRLGLSVVVHCEDQLLMLESSREQGQVDVFLKLNTGMNRLGIMPGRYRHCYDRLLACERVGQVTLMTHFATADTVPGVSEPLERFSALTQAIGAPRSMANSAALLRYPETHAEWVRPGIMLYGATPFPDESASQLGLQPAMTLSSAIIAVQEVPPGQGVGYGHTFTTDRPSRIGVVACGYADGYPRHAPTGTPIIVAGKSTRTLGRVSMDMLFADLTDIPEAGIGSPVELWGAHVSVDTVAHAAGTVGYELLCAIASRVPVVACESTSGHDGQG